MPKDGRPLNILLVTTDQQRGDCLGAEGHPVLRTPHLDGLATSPGGMWFRSAYAESPVCGPQRSSWIRGQHPLTFGGNRWEERIWQDMPPTLGEVFRDAGYRTGVFGKRHFSPLRAPYGFDEMKIYESGRNGEEPDDYLTWLRRETPWGGYARGHGIGNNDVFAGASVLPDEFYPSSWIARESVDFLERHAKESTGKPFLLWASFNKPHSPYDPPQPYDRLYRPQDVPSPRRAASLEQEIAPLQRAARCYGWHTQSEEQMRVALAYYYGLITHIDECLGRILNTLERLGLRENTAVAFTSDHGDMMGDHHVYFKGIFYEASTRVPYVWWVPPERRAELGIAAAGRVDGPVGISTLMPTLLDVAGVAKPKSADAGSLVPLLKDNAVAKNEVVAAYDAYQHNRNSTMLRWGKWKYIYWQYGAIAQLFDVEKDPGELHNLADDPAHHDVTREAHTRLEKRLAGYAYGKSDVLDAGGNLSGEPWNPEPGYMPAMKGPWGRRET